MGWAPAQRTSVCAEIFFWSLCVSECTRCVWCRHQASEGSDHVTVNSRHLATDNNKLQMLLQRRKHFERNLRDLQQHSCKNLLINCVYTVIIILFFLFWKECISQCICSNASRLWSARWSAYKPGWPEWPHGGSTNIEGNRRASIGVVARLPVGVNIQQCDTGIMSSACCPLTERSVQC